MLRNSLTGKQKSFLRSMGQKLEPVVMMGKEGVTPTVVKAAQEAEKEDAASSEMTWMSSGQSLITDEDGKVKGYKCPSCGAEMVADENTAATECPYCGNPAIIQQSFEGIYRPDLMIPFAVDKNAAKEKLLDFTKGKKLLPKSFTANNRVEDITGLYVPFWLYSCHAKGSVSFDAEKLSENINYMINTINKAKPASVKGNFIKSIVISSTMGPGIKIDIASFN